MDMLKTIQRKFASANELVCGRHWRRHAFLHEGEVLSFCKLRRSISSCWVFANSWKSKNKLKIWITWNRDSALANVLLAQLTCHTSVLNWEMQSRCCQWRELHIPGLCLKAYMRGFWSVYRVSSFNQVSKILYWCIHC